VDVNANVVTYGRLLLLEELSGRPAAPAAKVDAAVATERWSDFPVENRFLVMTAPGLTWSTADRPLPEPF